MGFQCRQFYLKDDQCAMKVSTDSLLFGAWVNIENAERILDMGTGCGILALMLAQRSQDKAVIDAIELDSQAAQQAYENVKASPWPDKIVVHQSDVTSFQPRERQYDRVVMNPPYFAHHLVSSNQERQLARQGCGDVWQVWLYQAQRLLAPGGRIAVVAPQQARDKIIGESSALELSIVRECSVQSTPNKPAYLVLLELVRDAQKLEPTQIEKVVIRDEAGHYTGTFKRITREFYLNFG